VVPIRRSPGEGVFGIGRLRAVRSLTGKARPAIIRAPDAAASTASPPNVRDDRDTPLCAGRDGGSYKGDLVFRKTRIFLRKGLDRGASDLPVGWGWRELKGEILLYVIPGHREAMSPESIARLETWIPGDHWNSERPLSLDIDPCCAI
jgi:hypothetical protein